MRSDCHWIEIFILLYMLDGHAVTSNSVRVAWPETEQLTSYLPMIYDREGGDLQKSKGSIILPWAAK